VTWTKDKAFRERLRTVMERDREILERLAAQSTPDAARAW